MQLKQITIPVVYAEYHTTGKHAAGDNAGLHEIILARARVTAAQEDLIIANVWPVTPCPPELVGQNKEFGRLIGKYGEDLADAITADQLKEMPLGGEYNRLVTKYGPELVESIYGKPHEGRLRHVCQRILEAFKKNMPLSKIIELGNPDADHMELEAETIVDKHMAATFPPADTTPGLRVPVAETPEGVAELGADDGTDDEEGPDGNLISFLQEERAWPPTTALAVARLVLEAKGQAIPDDKLGAVRGLKKRDALEAMRGHLREFTANKTERAATA